LKRFGRELQALEGLTLVLTHSLADLDACASAIVLADAIHAEARCPDKPTAAARHCLERLGLEIKQYNKEKFDNLILVDVSTESLLGGVNPSFFKRVLVVDHHYHNKRVKSNYAFIDAKRSSCAELIVEACNELNFQLTEKWKKLLLAGIIHDTAWFKSADSRSLGVVADLCKELDFQEVLGIARVHRDAAMVKVIKEGIGNAEIIELNKHLIGFTRVKAFELHTASTLVDAGCDYAFALDGKAGKMSGVKKAGAPGSIGKAMEAIGRAFEGNGGGHNSVGGAMGKPENAEAALKEAKKQMELLLLDNDNL